MRVLTLPLCVPYPGLRPFEEADEPVFFGRESQISAILRQLEDHQFVAVVGSSGSGKSSLVRAGLLPALREGFLFGVTDWVVPIIKPGHAPYQHLATALCQLEDTLQRPVSASAERNKKALSVDEALTMATLQKSDCGLINALHDAGLPEERYVMVVVDQFEEIFSFRRATAVNREEVTSRDEAAAFVNMLLRSCEDPKNRIWVVLTMRSDFIGHCEAFLGLPEAVSRSQFLVPRLDRKQMEDAITRPGEVKIAAFHPFSFQQDLVNRIVNDAGDRPDQLPMMQHTLMRTWKRAAGRNETDAGLKLTLDDYQQVGGIEEALSKHADEAWAKIKDDPKKVQIARSLFLLLCDVSPDGQITRRRPRVKEVIAVTAASIGDVAKVIQEFQEDDRNFLLPPLGQALTPDTYIDVSHEALLRRWHLFSDWLVEEREAAAELRRLVDRMKVDVPLQAKELDRIALPQKDNLVLREWAKRYVTADQWNKARAFVKKSAKYVKRQHDRKRNAVLAILTFLLAACGVCLFFMRRAQDAAQQANIALTDSFFRTIGAVPSADTLPPPRDQREALWELAQLGSANTAVRGNLLNRWFGTADAFTRGDVRSGQGFRAATGLNFEYHRLVVNGAVQLGKHLAEELEKETHPDRLSNRGTALAAVVAKMEPQAAAEIAKRGAQRLLTALKNPQETNSVRLLSLGRALAELVAKMEPQPAAEIAREGAQRLVTALESPQETNSLHLSTLGSALAGLMAPVARMNPQAAAEIAGEGAQRLMTALENPQETQPDRLSSLGSALAALAATMEPKAAAEIAGEGAQRLMTALENAQEMDPDHLSSLGSALAALVAPVAKIDPQAAAEIAKQGAQPLAQALESQDPQETDRGRLSELVDALAAMGANMQPQAAAWIAEGLAVALENSEETDSNRLSSLGRALAILADKMEPQVAAEIAKDLAEALKNPQETDSERLSSLGNALTKLEAKMEPQAAADIEAELATALENSQKTDSARLSSLGSALAALAARMEPKPAAEIAKRAAEDLETAFENPEADPDGLARLGSALGALVAPVAKMEPQAAAKIAGRGAKRLIALMKNPQEMESDRLSKLGKALAAFCASLPSARHTRLLALSDLLLLPVSKKEDQDEQQLSYRKLLTAVCAQLQPQDCAEVLKYPFSVGEAEQIVLSAFPDFGGNVWKFVGRADALRIKDVSNPAKRPSANEALNELEGLAN
jgi:hypothetical protein